MSRKYKDQSEVPDSVLIDRLNRLSDVVCKDRSAMDREFTMRIPAEVDRDADIVLSEAANRLQKYSEELDELRNN